MVSAGENNSAEIAIDGVSKQFRSGALALQDISMQVAQGEFVSLLGPSGCGKSTLLRLVSGLTLPSSGGVSVNGMTPANARALMSFIFQDATLLPWRTVERNVGLGLELEHAPSAARREKVARMLELVGLTHVAQRYPRQLSGGMKMRVSIARALVSRPRILLLDEPFAALDEMSRDRLNEELLRLYREQQWTVLFVTHSVAEAVFLSTRIVILAPHPGRIAHVVPVDLPWPRTAETRSTLAYEKLVVQVSRACCAVCRLHSPPMAVTHEAPSLAGPQQLGGPRMPAHVVAACRTAVACARVYASRPAGGGRRGGQSLSFADRVFAAYIGSGRAGPHRQRRRWSCDCADLCTVARVAPTALSVHHPAADCAHCGRCAADPDVGRKRSLICSVGRFHYLPCAYYRQYHAGPHQCGRKSCASLPDA
jgi:NitT/TauT family transport system ATP-binding protein